ncbi:MAG: 16S rRNA (adenine(1518)-N(6)/adenine(1519)-N(6))-dimethyltransferase RsmA [Patescibacteria group bacterium]|nr:16S rRNA (adenine(1518)-N(6)/adenine(1519)-N(6))-dimethyltransferase RsmA [Patescibacteria group bacterium]
MSFDTPAKIKQVLSKYNLRPIHGRGQNFLADKNIVDKIMAVAEIGKKDCVLEIGPGLGILTDRLATAKRVLSVEIDKKIVGLLASEYVWPNVTVLTSDILRVSNAEVVKILGCPRYSLVANLPYQITSAVIEKFLTTEPVPDRIIIMVQREVADRLLALDGYENLLSLLVKLHGRAKKLFNVSRGSFLPSPKVDSAVVEITPFSGPESKKVLNGARIAAVRSLIRAGFHSPRKMAISNLAKYTNLPKTTLISAFQDLGLDPKIRAEKFAISDWVNLARTVNC